MLQDLTHVIHFITTCTKLNFLYKGLDLSVTVSTILLYHHLDEPLKCYSSGFYNGQEAVTVVGYPLGGDTISVTKGVVSRIEVFFFLPEWTCMIFY